MSRIESGYRYDPYKIKPVSKLSKFGDKPEKKEGDESDDDSIESSAFPPDEMTDQFESGEVKDNLFAEMGKLRMLAMANMTHMNDLKQRKNEYNF